MSSLLLVFSLLSLLAAVIYFAGSQELEGLLAVVLAMVWGWVGFDLRRGNRRQVGTIREALPAALFFLVLPLQSAIRGVAWLVEDDPARALWAFAIAVAFTALGTWYLWFRRRLPRDKRL
jgi:hypothetical protein